MESIKQFLLNLAMRYIVWYSRKSTYVTHAKKEFEIAWSNKEDDDDGMQDFMCKQIIELLSVLATHGDSGFSIGYKLRHFQNAANFKIIAPLTFKDEEFNLVSNEGIWQNKRLSGIFKYADGTYSYNDDVLLREKYYIGEDNVVVERDSGTFHSGTMFVLYSDGYIRCFSGLRIRDINKFKQESIVVDCYAVEYPNDWWISLCSEGFLDKVNERYFYQNESPEKIAKEIEFDGGIHASEILKRIEIVGKHMYGESFILNNL